MSNLDQLRRKFLDFYLERAHAIIPSSSLVPENDSSTLFTGSGMQPLVPYFLGQPHPQGTRLADSQKSFRADDIEEVGDARHITFFEMLGNWSLGDYSKEKQLPWVFEFMTQGAGLDPSKLFVTVFAGDSAVKIARDDESIKIWQELFASAGIKAGVVAGPGVDAGKLAALSPDEEARIFCYGVKKNWWSRSGTPSQMPAGEPGGPDSEIFYDFGANLKLHENSPWRDEPCHLNCDCGRFLEIGNSVFMQYQKQNDGSFTPLAQPNVDYGGGLERLLMAVENSADIFLTSAFYPFVQVLEKMLHFDYKNATDEQKRSCRVIIDHLRSAVMLIADGVVPSPKEQGYVLRRLIRRAVRFARNLDIHEPFLATVAEPVIKFYQDYYTDLQNKVELISSVLTAEEKKFATTLEKGLRELDKLPVLDGQAAFFLYESYGFPFELTAEIAAERGQTLLEADFLAAKKTHQDASRAASTEKFKGGLADAQERTVAYHTATHLLLATLRALISPDILQKGSNITAQRARFDFNFDRALTDKEITQLENRLNELATASLPITCTTLPKNQALKEVTVAAFADRYPDEVTLYSIGDISREICMGPHVTNTSQLGTLKITKQKAVSTGVRRLYLEISYFGYKNCHPRKKPTKVSCSSYNISFTTDLVLSTLT